MLTPHHLTKACIYLGLKHLHIIGNTEQVRTTHDWKHFRKYAYLLYCQEWNEKTDIISIFNIKTRNLGKQLGLALYEGWGYVPDYVLAESSHSAASLATSRWWQDTRKSLLPAKKLSCEHHPVKPQCVFLTLWYRLNKIWVKYWASEVFKWDLLNTDTMFQLLSSSGNANSLGQEHLYIVI